MDEKKISIQVVPNEWNADPLEWYYTFDNRFECCYGERFFIRCGTKISYSLQAIIEKLKITDEATLQQICATVIDAYLRGKQKGIMIGKTELEHQIKDALHIPWNLR